MRQLNESKSVELSYYVPHLTVYKKFSTSIKTYVVFDASMKSTSGYSLNDILHKRPVFQPEMFSQIICFRLHKYVYTADVTKMYLQILMHSDCTTFTGASHEMKNLKSMNYY